MKLRKIISAVLMLSAFGAASAEAKSLEFTINSPDMYISDGGIKKEELDSPAYIENGRTLVPIRVISEHFGASVEWKAEENKAVIASGETVIEITIGADKAVVNGEEKPLDCPAVITNGRTMIPLRFISEELKKTVEYIGLTNQVIITDEAPVLKVGDTTCSLEDVRTLCAYFGVGSDELLEFIPQATEYLKQNSSFAEAARLKGITPDSETVAQLKASFDEVKDQVYAVSLIAPIAKIRYLELCAYNYVTGFNAEFPEETVKKEFEENFVSAKHILIATSNLTTGEEYTPAQKGAAKAKAEEVLMKLRDGADFDSLVEEYNEDPGMVESPGGYVFTYGEMVEPFEKAAFDLKPGQVSEIVESSFGYHIIKREALPELSEEYIPSVQLSLKEQAVYASAEEIAVQELMTAEEIVKALTPLATEEK